MQLKSLEIQGFKSFPDRTRMEFGRGITGVVGPNGSGKSNIVDAVRWVFGEQSTKTLRGEKMEDVIFGGTQNRKPQGFASVVLVIDNSDRSLPIENDEIAVCRKLYRSGESEYRINNSNVRLKDVHELFMDTGLGRDGYSVIGQGRIAEIISSKSRERREIFEEAAGISKFRYRKSEAEKRLALAEENLLRLRDILSELEGRVEPLRRESEKAAQFVKLAEEKRVLEISVWMEGLRQHQKQLRENEDRCVEIRTRHEEAEKDNAKLEAEISACYEQMQQCTVEIDRIHREMQEHADLLSRREAESAVIRNNIQHNDQTAAELRRELEGSAAGDDELEQKLRALTDEIASLGEKAETLAGHVAELRTRGRETTARDSELAARIDGRKAGRAAIYQSITDAKLSGATAQSLMEETVRRMENLRLGSQVGEENLVRIRRELSDCRELLAGIDESLEGLTNTRRGYELKESTRREKYTALQEERTKRMDQAKALRQRKSLLEDMERNMEGYAHSVKYLLRQAETGTLRGIHGPVSRLITTREEHSTAIEIALGGAMQNIVVTDEGAAKAAIRTLTQSRQGRATFLPLTSVKGTLLQERGLEDCEGFIGIASELVRYEPRYEGVIRWLLGRIVVAENLDRAVEMARRYRYKFRIVTLDGQVVNTGGSMTGGYVAKSAGVLGRQGEIRRLGEEADRIEGSAKEIIDRMQKLEGELNQLKTEIWGVDVEFRTASEDKIRYQAEQKRLELALADAQKAGELARKEEQELTGRMEELRAKNLSSDQVLSDLQKQLAGEEQALAELAAQREALAASAAESARALNEGELELLGLRKDEEAARQQREQLSLQQGDRRQHRADLERRIGELQRASEASRGEITALAESCEQLRRESEALSGSITETAARRDDCERRATQLRAGGRELTARREELARELARFEERGATLQGEYDAIITRLWDEYELTRSQAEEIAVELEDAALSRRRLMELRGRIKALGNVNVGSIEEYREVSERYRFLKAQVDDVEQSRTELGRLIGDLTGQMQEIFRTNFRRISENFTAIFTELFGGGRASLALSEPDNVLDSGIEIYVQPPGKLIKNLASLSGGEQAFVAIAIYFAILKVNPAPFCLLDEIEAALDDVNVTKFAQYLRHMTNKTQFIAITHRRGTMEEADVLYGVTMQEEGVSKLLELNVSEVESKLGIK